MNTNQLPQRQTYPYHAYYCEENIWHLCQQPALKNSDVVLISAIGDHFPILCQQTAAKANMPVFWDYHVVLLWHHEDEHYILDFDTTLPFCTPAVSYIKQSFIDEQWLKAHQTPLLRVMPARDYITHLRSDRRHMQTAEGDWLVEPPPWSAISTHSSNLHQLTDMNHNQYGQVLTVKQLLSRLQHHTH